eukprot:scaffold408_cov347-Pavlova_lutheri.AAC.34
MRVREKQHHRHQPGHQVHLARAAFRWTCAALVVPSAQSLGPFPADERNTCQVGAGSVCLCAGLHQFHLHHPSDRRRQTPGGAWEVEARLQGDTGDELEGLDPLPIPEFQACAPASASGRSQRHCSVLERLHLLHGSQGARSEDDLILSAVEYVRS